MGILFLPSLGLKEILPKHHMTFFVPSMGILFLPEVFKPLLIHGFLVFSSPVWGFFFYLINCVAWGKLGEAIFVPSMGILFLPYKNVKPIDFDIVVRIFVPSMGILFLPLSL